MSTKDSETLYRWSANMIRVLLALLSLFVIRPKVWTSTSTNLNIQGGFGSFRSTLYPSCLFDNKISAASTSDNSQNTFVWINSNTLVKVYNANPSTENAHNNRTNHTNDLAFAKTKYYTGRLSPSQDRLFLSRTSYSTTRQNIVYSFVPSVSQICGRNVFMESGAKIWKFPQAWRIFIPTAAVPCLLNISSTQRSPPPKWTQDRGQ